MSIDKQNPCCFEIAESGRIKGKDKPCNICPPKTDQPVELWKHLRDFINGKSVDELSKSVTRKAYAKNANELSVAGLVRLCVEELFWMAEKEGSPKRESSLQDLASHKFDTSGYVYLNDGISRVCARDISEAPKDSNDILLYGVDENGLARYEVGSWQQMEPDMWMWTCEYPDDGITPSQWFHLPDLKRNQIEDGGSGE